MNSGESYKTNTVAVSWNASSVILYMCLLSRSLMITRVHVNISVSVLYILFNVYRFPARSTIILTSSKGKEPVCHIGSTPQLSRDGLKKADY